MEFCDIDDQELHAQADEPFGGCLVPGCPTGSVPLHAVRTLMTAELSACCATIYV